MTFTLTVRHRQARFLQQHPTAGRRPAHVCLASMPWSWREVLYRHRCLHDATMLSDWVSLKLAAVQEGYKVKPRKMTTQGWSVKLFALGCPFR